MKTWMKNLNNFQIARAQSESVALHLLDCFQSHPGVAYKSIAYKKRVYSSDFSAREIKILAY